MNAKNSEAPRPSFPPPQEAPRPPLSPLKAFLLVLALMLTAGTILTFQDSESQSIPSQSPKTSLPIETTPKPPPTEKQAKAILKRLRLQEQKEYREANRRLVHAIYTPSSPMLKTVLRELKLLRDKKVSDRTRFVTKHVTVEEATSSQMVMREVVIVRSRFIDRRGVNITHNPIAERQVIRWTLRFTANAWRIHQALVVAANPAQA